jgi:hypothetical protein
MHHTGMLYMFNSRPEYVTCNGACNYVVKLQPFEGLVVCSMHDLTGSAQWCQITLYTSILEKPIIFIIIDVTIILSHDSMWLQCKELWLSRNFLSKSWWQKSQLRAAATVSSGSYNSPNCGKRFLELCTFTVNVGVMHVPYFVAGDLGKQLTGL